MISFTGEGMKEEEERGGDLALLKASPRLASLAYIINEPANNFPKFFFFLFLFLFQRTEIKNDFLPREKKNGMCILINREMFPKKNTATSSS